MTSASIFRIILNKFSYSKKFSQVILLIIDKIVEIDFHNTVLPLGSAISLKIESHKKLSLNSKKITK